MNKTKLFLFVGLSLVTGFIWGRIFSLAMPQHYSDFQIRIMQYDRMVSVDVIQNKDDIWIVDHKTGHLIFEYNQFKEADKEAFGEYEGLLVEVLREK